MAWYENRKGGDFQKIAEKFRISAITARIMRNRDIVGEEAVERFLNGSLNDLNDPFLLPDMKQAADTLKKAIEDKKKIRIVGDYDVDGVCSTYILYRGITSLGGSADTAIPHRIRDGYGLNRNIIEKAHEDGVELIVTCDNGIAAKEELDLSYSLGIPAIVTDHHEIPFTENENGEKLEILPQAEAVIDPKRSGSLYPFPGICGGVVAFKFMQACGISAKVQEELLEFAAFTTICDVMELVDENRILVKEGLKRIRKTSNTGLKALIHVTGVVPEDIDVYHIGFILGPCLNATGRLEDARMALEIFQEQDYSEAVLKAANLKNLNDRRKEMTEEGVQRAVELVEENFKNDPVLVVFLENCHESIAGIIAGRIKERYNCPTLILTATEEGVKGSGRSIEAYDMFTELSKCKELFTRFGGHKMAAGLSLPKENVDELRNRLLAECKLTPKDREKKVLIDVPLPLSYVSEELLEDLKVLEPFGVGNPKPVFAKKDGEVQRLRILGKNKNVLKFSVADEAGCLMDMMYFGDVEEFHTFLRKKHGEEGEKLWRGEKAKVPLTFTYYPGINEFNGNRTLQLTMTDYLR